MIRSRGSGPWLLTDYESEVEGSCGFGRRTMLLEVCNIGTLREAIYFQNFKRSHGLGRQALGEFSKAEQRVRGGDRVEVVFLAPLARAWGESKVLFAEIFHSPINWYMNK